MSARFWPIAESAQADYEQLREFVLAGGQLGEVLAARRFARRGLAGLISWPTAEPVFLGSLSGAPRPPWSGSDDPREQQLRAHSPDGRCPERNIRADELDEYVFGQVRQVLLDPKQLIAGERAVIAGAPANENELVAAQLKRLDSALNSNERERTRLLDAYQAGPLDLNELTRRTATLTARRDQLAKEKTTLAHRSAELATENRLRRRLAGFAEQIATSLDDLDIDGRRRLLRLVVERIRVTGWRVEIQHKIPLPDDPEDDDHDPTEPQPDDHRQAIRACVPFVDRTCAWWSSRSTVAVAMLLGISSSNPLGWMLEEIAIERFSYAASITRNSASAESAETGSRLTSSIYADIRIV